MSAHAKHKPADMTAGPADAAMSEADAAQTAGPEASPGSGQGQGQGQGQGMSQGQGQGMGRGMAPAVAAGGTPAVAVAVKPPILPSAGAVIQAGAFGAALSGVTAAVSDTLMVKAGHMTANEAVKDVAKAAVQGAATMVVASTVAHAVRARPLIGMAVLAVAGIGLFMMLNDRKAKPRRRKAAPADTPVAEQPAARRPPAQK